MRPTGAGYKERLKWHLWCQDVGESEYSSATSKGLRVVLCRIWYEHKRWEANVGIKVSANSPCAALLVMDTGCCDDGRMWVGTVALAMGGGLLICINLDKMCSLWARLQLSIFAHARKHCNTIGFPLLSVFSTLSSTPHKSNDYKMGRAKRGWEPI